MGLFGNDDQQDERLDGLEYHVRLLSDAVQQNQLDIAGGLVALIAIQAQVDDKLSESDFDPSIIALNKQIEEARVEIGKASGAASDSWKTLNAGAGEALTALRTSVQSANADLKKKLDD